MKNIFKTCLGASLLSTQVHSEIIHLSSENTPQQALPAYQYVAVNFYDDSTQASLSVFSQAEEIFQRDKHPHSPSVGFAEVNVQKYPELALADMKPESLPLQLVIGAGQMRGVDVNLLSSEAETAELYAEVVRQMTSSHLVQIDCEGVE